MNQFYMDTNVFISGLKPDDPYHSAARVIIGGLEKDGGELEAETSVLTLLEVSSVSSRLYEANYRPSAAERKKKKANQRGRTVFMIRALKRLAGLRIKFIHMAGDTPISVRGVEATLPSVFNEAIMLNLRHSSLRTLDLIHLAAAVHAKRRNSELGAFVTGDKGFLDEKKELAETIQMPILSPRDYVEGLGLK